MTSRFLAFIIVFLILAYLEKIRPFRLESRTHFKVNFLLIAISWLLSFPVSTFILKTNFSDRFLQSDLGLVDWIYGILLLDFAIYLQHYLSHRITLLWKLHRIHHSETIMTVTTGVRFHPFEILVSLLYKLAVVAIFNIDFRVYIAFEIILNLASLFSHANISIPDTIESFLRRFWITPSLHRIHHSTQKLEENTNFGLTSCLWDRLFRTYLSYDVKRIESITLGLDGLSSESPSDTAFLLKWPFLK